MAVSVAGAITGVIYLRPDASVSDLRREIVRLMRSEGETPKLILSGRTLQDNQLITSLVLPPSAKILVMRGAGCQPAAGTDDAARAKRLEHLSKAVEKIASSGGYELTIENQDGGGLHFDAQDKKALSIALAFHAKSKSSYEDGNLSQSLDEALKAEEAFELVRVDLMVDNPALNILDLMWTALKLRDLSMLGSAKERLAKARRMLTVCYGAGLERAKLIQSSEVPRELAAMIRLEVLEGVSAYFSKDINAARHILSATKDKVQQFQVSDESLAALMSMGFGKKEAIRSLRECNRGAGIEEVVAKIESSRANDREVKQRRRKMKAWLQERGIYGKIAAPQNGSLDHDAYVSPGALDALAGIGYDRKVAGEALRLTGNDLNAALTFLSDPTRIRHLTLEVAFMHSCWIERFDETRGRKYWINRLNKGSVWVQPSFPPLSAGEMRLLKKLAKVTVEAFRMSRGEARQAATATEEEMGGEERGQADDRMEEDVEGQGGEAMDDDKGEEDEVEAEVKAMEDEVMEGVRRRARAEVDLSNDLDEESQVIVYFLGLCSNIQV
jgi:hypothetical protein